MDKQQQNQLPNYRKSTITICDGNDDSQSKYHCGFITHVQSATLLIGAVGSLAGSGVLVSLLKANADPDQCVLAGMILCSYALLVLGWSVRTPCFYWPFLLLNPLLMLLTAIFCTYPSLDAFLAPIVFPTEHRMNMSNLRPKQQLLLQVTHSLCSMELITSLCAIFLLGYFQSIVFRAHNWLRKQNKLDEQLVIIGDQTP